MATEQDFAPYAPAKSVLAVIEKYRSRGLPDPLNAKVLTQIGVPDSMGPRTLQALRFLGLIDENGSRLAAFGRLKKATTEEYPGQLAEVVRAAYLPVFTIVNPSEDNEIALNDAFRHYEPSAQRNKMVALFRGLCEECGIMPRSKTQGAVRIRKPELNKREAPKPGTPKPKSASEKPQESQDSDVGTGEAYRLISAIIQQLPRERKWNPKKRDRWIQAMTSAIDLLVELEDDPSE